jgi:hypothetical protein
MSGLVSIRVIAFFLFFLEPSTIFEESDEAKLLIEKARQHRISQRLGTVSYRMDYKWYSEEGEVTEDSEVLELTWKDDKIYRYSTGRNKDEQYPRYAIQNDGVLTTYDQSSKRVLIGDRDRDTGEIFFDPRILGCWPVLKVRMPVDQMLSPDVGDSTYLRTEKLGDRSCHVVCWKHKIFGDEVILWIDDEQSHSILRTHARHTTYENRYERGIIVPTETTVRRVNSAGREEYLVRYTLLDFQPRVAEGSTFSMRDFELPIATPIVDLRVNQITGFWDGNQSMKTYFEAMNAAGLMTRMDAVQQRRFGVYQYVMFVLFAIGVLVVIVTLVQRRRRALGTAR